jgi:hypothetical protein
MDAMDFAAVRSACFAGGGSGFDVSQLCDGLLIVACSLTEGLLIPSETRRCA